MRSPLSRRIAAGRLGDGPGTLIVPRGVWLACNDR